MEYLRFGFEAAFCVILFTKGCNVINTLSAAISRLEVTQARFLAKLNEKKTD